MAAAFKGLELLRSDKGPVRAALLQASLGPVTLVSSSLTGPLVAQARIDSGLRMFVLRPEGGAPLLVNGHALDENRLLDLRPGTTLHAATLPPAGSVQLIALHARPGDLDRVSRAAFGRPFTAGPALCSLMEPEPRAHLALRTLCSDTLASSALAATDDPGVLGEALLSALVQAVESDVRRGLGHELTRDFEARIVARAAAAPDAETRAVPLSDLCAAGGVGERQLQRAFHTVYGLGPRRFFKLRRLHAARQVLMHATPDTTVAAVASAHGFFDPGRFAGDYRGLFGESPSATLGARENPDAFQAAPFGGQDPYAMTPAIQRHPVEVIIDARAAPPAQSPGTSGNS
jgi:AraC family ethanolamine operon transcriptional activator